LVPTRTPATGVMPMRSRQSAGWGTEQVPTRHRRRVLAWQVLGWHLVAWHVVRGWHRAKASWHALTWAWRSAVGRHPALRFAQIAPLGLLLWGLDMTASLRAGAATAGLRHAVTVNSVSLAIGGRFAVVMNEWLAVHHVGALAATYYYILLQGALTGVLGALLIWRRVPSFALHRNALIAVTALGLVAFWCYPVAPPRLLPGYHDIVASALPAFSAAVEPNGSAVYASLPSLHVAWAIWGAIAGMALVGRPILRALFWLYPAATITDVLATANHYLLDAVTAVGLLVIGYGIAVAADRARTHRASRRALDGAPAASPAGAIRLAYGALSPGAIALADGASLPRAIRLADGASLPRAIRVAYCRSSPQGTDGRHPGSSPQAIDGRQPGSSPQAIDGRHPKSSPQAIDGRHPKSSPQAINGGHPESSARATRAHGAVLVCALPEADCRGRSGDGARRR
jgi:PAP2 superfamily